MGRHTWEDRDARFVTQRYNKIAPLITLFEWLLGVPAGFRRKTIEALDLQPGQAVLEIGCGTGRNLPYLRKGVGDCGHVYGIDLSEGMLSRASRLRGRRGWNNVHLEIADAATYKAPEPLNAILFGFSYNTMPNHQEVLARAWEQLRPGGVLVVMDAKVPPGKLGQWVLPFSVWLMKRTLLGNPFIKPWEHIKAYDPDLIINDFREGAYYFCRAVKKPVSQTVEASPQTPVPISSRARELQALVS